MANTYQAIATTTVGSGGAATIEFTSIPQTYTDLVLKLSARHDSSSPEGVTLKINSITTGYTSRFISGSGASDGSGTRTTYQGWDIASVVNYSTTTSNTFANVEVYIPNYASSNQKSASSDSVQESNATTAYMYMLAHLQTSTAAITSLTCSVQGSNNFVQYSTATLYGIKNS